MATHCAVPTSSGYGSIRRSPATNSSTAPARPSNRTPPCDFVACLIATIAAAVDPEVPKIEGGQETYLRMHLHVAAHAGIELPRVVDRRLHEDTAHIPASVEGHFAIRELPPHAAPEHVPVDRLLLGPVRKVTRLVIQHTGHFGPSVAH